MQTVRFVVKQIFTPKRTWKPILRSFCTQGSSTVRKWHNWIPIKQKPNEAETNWHLQNCTLRQNTWNYKRGVQPVIYGQACKYMKTLVKKPIAKSALSNGDESWTADKGRLAGISRITFQEQQHCGVNRLYRLANRIPTELHKFCKQQNLQNTITSATNDSCVLVS